MNSCQSPVLLYDFRSPRPVVARSVYAGYPRLLRGDGVLVVRLLADGDVCARRALARLADKVEVFADYLAGPLAVGAAVLDLKCAQDVLGLKDEVEVAGCAWTEDEQVDFEGHAANLAVSGGYVQAAGL